MDDFAAFGGRPGPVYHFLHLGGAGIPLGRFGPRWAAVGGVLDGLSTQSPDPVRFANEVQE